MASETDNENLRELKKVARDMGLRWERRYVEAAIQRIEAAEAEIERAEQRARNANRDFDMREAAIVAHQQALEAAEKRVAELETAIAKHRDQKGDDRCWLDDQDLYGVIGTVSVDTSLPCREQFMESCRRFYEQRRAPHDWSPSNGMTIGQLEARVAELEAMLRVESEAGEAMLRQHP